MYTFMVVKRLHTWSDPNTWSHNERWVHDVYEDTPMLRKQLHNHPHAEILITGLTEDDAYMWVKMMRD